MMGVVYFNKLGWVVGKVGYGRTRTRTFSKSTFTFMQYMLLHLCKLFFIPNAVFTAVFASRPRRRSFHSVYSFISARAKD